jgi:xylulokinase
MGYLLGVDIGTYETKGVITDETGKILGQDVRKHEMLVPQSGWAEHRAEEDWWGDFVHVTKNLLDKTSLSGVDIDAVACSAIGPCMLPVDAEGRPLMNGVLYGVDTRAEKQIEFLNKQIGTGVILARCGNALTSQSVGPKILWLAQERPEEFDKTAKFLTSTSFLTYRLTGRYVIDHYTASSFSPFYDLNEQNWCFDLDKTIRAENLPELLWSNEIAGAVTEQAAAETGLAQGTPVTCGTVDAAAEALSVGAIDGGDMMMMYGSTVFIILVTEQQLTDPRLWHAPWLFKDKKAAMAGLSTSGTLTHWFRDHLARDLGRDNAFPELVKEAVEIEEGSGGLICLPYFSGERTPIHDPLAKGAFYGLNLTHTRAHLYRALIEGMAYSTRHITDTFEQAGQVPSRLLGVGGGTKNSIWLQATSDITGLDQIIPEITIGASYGDAFMAALALGRVGLEDIKKWNPPKSEVSARHIECYDRYYPLFLKLYQQTKDIAHDLS